MKKETENQLKVLETQFAMEAMGLLVDLGLSKKPEMNKETILIVDDSKTLLMLLSSILEKERYSYKIAENGELGLDILKKQPIHAVFADVNMPLMNGLEMLKRMNDDPNLKTIPVFMLTTMSDKEMVVSARKWGAKGWLIKPPTIEKVRASLSRVFQKL